MVVKVFCQYNKKTKTFDYIKIKGHANYNNKGQDLVCAAVSAITNGTINFLQSNYSTVCGKIICCPAEIIISNNELYNGSSDYDLCLQMMIYQLQNISEKYPNNIQIKTNYSNE